MKTEAEVLGVVRRLYAEMGREPAELVRVKPLYGGWYNALKYEVVRADHAVTPIWRKDIDDSNYDAIRDALKSSAEPDAKKRSCGQCGQGMPGDSRYCWGCGHRLVPPHDVVPADNDRLATARRLNHPRRVAVIGIALTCVAAALVYRIFDTSGSIDGVLVQPVMAINTTPADDGVQPSWAPPVAEVIAAAPTAVAASRPTSGGEAHRPLEDPQADARPELALPPQQSAPVSLRSASHAAPKRAREPTPVKSSHKLTSVRLNGAPPALHTVDIAYKRLAVTQCAAGVAGLLCREKLKFSLCKERWTEHNVPGMGVCRVAAHAPPLS